MLKTWQKIFPSTVKPMSDMSAQLMSHVRYPADLFKVQRSVLGQYHVTDAGSFYSREDAWTTPNDPTSPPSNPTLQPPYYLTMQMPGQDAPAVLALLHLHPCRRRASRADRCSRAISRSMRTPATTKGKVASGYGKLRLLTLPSSDTVPGPGQVQNKFNSDPTRLAAAEPAAAGQDRGASTATC